MKYCALDIESIGLTPYGGKVWVVTWTMDGKKISIIFDPFGIKKLPKELIAILVDKKICKVIQNALFDVPYIELVFGVKIVNIWDIMDIEKLVTGVSLGSDEVKIERLRKAYGVDLGSILVRYGFPEPDKSVRDNFVDREDGVPITKQEQEYAKNDVRYLLAIQRAQEFILKRDGQLESALLRNLAVERIARMRANGIGVDEKIWREVEADNRKELSKRLAKLPKTVANWNSPKQVKDYFKSIGILIESFKDFDKVYLQTKNKTLGDVIATREYQKSVTAFGLPFLKFIDGDGKIRCGVTASINTNRMSMDHPNLQQLPGNGNSNPLRLIVLEMVTGDKKKMPQHRRAFVPQKGNTFVIGDFSGQELGIMASMADEKMWIEAMLRGEDIHGLTAYSIGTDEWNSHAEKGCMFPFKCSCKHHKQMRKPAKINNFMLAYGGGADKFAEYTGADRLTARVYVAAHKRTIPSITRVLARNGQEALESGVSYSADPYKSRRVLRGQEAWQVVNQGKNNPIQYAGSNMIKLALISLPEWMKVVLMIHDEIVVECKKSEAKKVAKILKQVMEDAAAYITGIKGLIKVDPRIAMNLMKDE